MPILRRSTRWEPGREPLNPALRPSDRCRVTQAGRARGAGEADLLRRVLDLAGVPGDGLPSNLAAADPR
jgi:hypothetical protein